MSLHSPLTTSPGPVNNMGTTVSSASPQRHLVLFNYEEWGEHAALLAIVGIMSLRNPFVVAGHIRPICNFAARIVKMQPTVLITHFITPKFYDRAQTELRRNFEEQESSLLARIRCVCIRNHRDV